MSRHKGIKILNTEDMFGWWCREKIKNKPHLRYKCKRSGGTHTKLVSINKDEIKWLTLEVFRIEKELLNYSHEDENAFELRNQIRLNNIKLNALNKLNPKTETVVFRYPQFKKIVAAYNLKIRDKMVFDGSLVNMKSGMGYLLIYKVMRADPTKWNYKKTSHKSVDWQESYKYRDELLAKGIEIKTKDNPEGKKWLVYFTDEFYIKYHWTTKGYACKVKNHGYYKFYPTMSAKGSKRFLSRENKKNKMLHMRYQTKKMYSNNLPLKDI